MHDLSRDYALSISEHDSIVNHGDKSEWPTKDKSQSYERVSLTCMGMSAFPGEFNYPNLLLLKLMNGDESLKFPQDFYGRMEKLLVIDYENLQNPMLPVSLQCSTHLRTLRLHSCSLMDDFSHIGNLMNLEILSFVNCGIRKLPSTIGNLKFLKLLDLTGCIHLQIDDGVFANLHRLEELYMRVDCERGIRFTDANCDELKKLSENLYALEVEFFKKKDFPKNMSFDQIERFRISMGTYLEEGDGNFENTLDLVANKDELLKSGINELFRKTEVLYLHVEDMNCIEDVLEPLRTPRPSWFKDLRVLKVSECEKLAYLFSFPISQRFYTLERLKVSSCPNMQEIVHVDDHHASEKIRFQKLKFLSLSGLPKLESLCRNVDTIELPELVKLRLEGLPNFTSIYSTNKSSTTSMGANISTTQPFLNKEVVIPKLEKLNIKKMEKLKEIWACQFSGGGEVDVCALKEISVEGCDGLVNLFPENPMSLLHHLEELDVTNCGSIESIFNIDLGSVCEIEESNSNLRIIRVEELGKLKEVWRVKDVNNSHHIIHGFGAVEEIKIKRCKRFRNVFTPTTANFDLGALKKLTIDRSKPWRAQIDVVSDEKITEIDDDVPNVVFSSHLKPTFHHLEHLELVSCNEVEVVFEIESGSSIELATIPNNQQPLLLPHLKFLELTHMERMSHVWKCNWNKSLISQQHQESSFHNLTQISLWHCRSIKYLFSPLMTKLLSNLKKASINCCYGMDEVVSNRDDVDAKMFTSTSTLTNMAFFFHLDYLDLCCLPCLESIDVRADGRNVSTPNNTHTDASIHDQIQCAQATIHSWSLCQYTKRIYIGICKALPCVIPSHLVGRLQNLEELEIFDCESMVELFESKWVNNNSIHVDEGSCGTNNAMIIPRQINTTLLELPNLKELDISNCNLLGHVFMVSTIDSLKQLKKLEIWSCKAMQVIVKEEDGEHTTSSKIVVFPRLESLTLGRLPNLKGFFKGKNDFEWPSLDYVRIDGCPEMMMFTPGHSMAPKLKCRHTRTDPHSVECDLNFRLTTESHEVRSSMEESD